VDFVLENKGEVIPVEVKYSSKRAVGKSFYSFLDKFKPSQGIILTKDYLKEERIGKTKVKFIPISYM
jgi:predicted AAA+ superfamily ATPase